MTERTGKKVLVVEDRDDPEPFKRWFEMTFSRGGNVRLALQGDDVCETYAQAHPGLMRALDAGALPDVVVIDNFLPGGGRDTVPRGMERMAAVTSECADRGTRRPPCILWTQGDRSRTPTVPHPCVCHAFCEAGGHNVVDKRWDWEEQLADIVATVSDAAARWAPSPSPPRLKNPGKLESRRRALALLPYFEAGLTANEISQPTGVDSDAVAHARRDIRMALSGRSRRTAASTTRPTELVSCGLGSESRPKRGSGARQAAGGARISLRLLSMWAARERRAHS